MNRKDILASIVEIEISIAADSKIRCWDSPYCPYCMLRTLKNNLKEDIKCDDTL